MNWEDACNGGYVEMLVDSAHGIYVPQVFARSYVLREPALDEDMEICASGPDGEFYWDAWMEILDNGTIEGLSGAVYRIFVSDDGDVFAIDDSIELDDD
jgi:hypothetical protein